MNGKGEGDLRTTYGVALEGEKSCMLQTSQKSRWTLHLVATAGSPGCMNVGDPHLPLSLHIMQPLYTAGGDVGVLE